MQCLEINNAPFNVSPQGGLFTQWKGFDKNIKNQIPQEGEKKINQAINQTL